MDNLTYPEWLRKLADALSAAATGWPIYLCHIVDTEEFRDYGAVEAAELRQQFTVPYPEHAARLLGTIGTLQAHNSEHSGLTTYFASLYEASTDPTMRRAQWLRGLAVQAEEDAVQSTVDSTS